MHICKANWSLITNILYAENLQNFNWDVEAKKLIN